MTSSENKPSGKTLVISFLVGAIGMIMFIAGAVETNSPLLGIVGAASKKHYNAMLDENKELESKLVRLRQKECFKKLQ
jgi:hypothetical protein